MSLTINTKTFTADGIQKDSVVYNGPAHTFSAKDDLKLARTAAKATAAFSGISRTQSKLSRTLSLTGALTLTGDAYVDIQIGVPIGASSADVDALLNDMGSFLSSASYKTHVKNLTVNF